MNYEPVLLDARMRSAVEKAILDTCFRRGRALYSYAVRTNHAHLVTTGGCSIPTRD